MIEIRRRVFEFRAAGWVRTQIRTRQGQAEDVVVVVVVVVWGLPPSAIG